MSGQWRPRQRNYDAERKAGVLVGTDSRAMHPLLVEEKAMKTMTVRTLGGDVSPAKPAESTEAKTVATAAATTSVAADPLGVVKAKAVVSDPLGVVGKPKALQFDPLGVTGRAPSAVAMPDAPFTPAPSILAQAVGVGGQIKSEEDELEEMIEEGFVPWASKKGAILQKYTTDQTVGIMAAFMQDVPNRVNLPVETTQKRLHELERGEDDEERLLQVSQADYIRHIESLEGALRKAWDEEQNRVLALKIAIRCAKVLGDTSVIQFYPSKFVLVSEILDAFGNLVFQRIKERGAEEDGHGKMRNLPADFTAADVNEFARETCKNWFHKVASIRELLPRLYVEMALLHCYRFIYNDPFEALLTRVNMQLRGVCDPLVATYARAYLARVGLRLKPRLKPYLLTGFVDHLDVMKQNIDSARIERICRERGIDPLKYYDLYSPALDWMLQCLAHNNKSAATLALLLARYKQMGDALTLNHIVRNFHPSVAAANCLAFCTLIREADDRGLRRDRLWASLGAALIMTPPPASVVVDVWREVWASICSMAPLPSAAATADGAAPATTTTTTTTTTTAQQPDEQLTAFVNLCEIWIEFPVKYLSMADVSSTLAAILERLRTPNKAYVFFFDQLQSMAQKILSGFPNFAHVARMERFHELLDLFTGDHQVQVHKAVLRSFRAMPSDAPPVNDPLLIEHVFTAAKTVHDSINSLSFDDERRQVAELLCAFISRVDFGRQVEKQLTFLSDARRAFGNFDAVKARLVHCVFGLVMRTLALAGGVHTSLTTPFVRACIAYCYITIPSIEATFTRLELYVASANVALQNGAIGQAEDLLKSAVTLFSELPPHAADLESELVRRRCRQTEEQVAEFATRFVALLVVMPGHPELGPFYLLSGFLRVLRAFAWMPGSDVPLRINYAMLCALCALAQDTLPLHIAGVESNDVLYGGDELYRKDLFEMIDEIVSHSLEQLAALKTANADLQSVFTAELFDLTATLADLGEWNAQKGPTPHQQLAVNLFTLAKNGPATAGIAHLRRAFAALRYREAESPFQRFMLTKLSVP